MPPELRSVLDALRPTRRRGPRSSHWFNLAESALKTGALASRRGHPVLANFSDQRPNQKVSSIEQPVWRAGTRSVRLLVSVALVAHVLMEVLAMRFGIHQPLINGFGYIVVLVDIAVRKLNLKNVARLIVTHRSYRG